MRILLIHNKYIHKGGEDIAFETELNLLRQNNHTVYPLIFDNAKMNSKIGKIRLSIGAIYNSNSARRVSEVIKDFTPNVIHVHNHFYVASPSIFYVAKKFKIPILLTLHNYRLICSGALLMRNSQSCELCTKKKFPLYGVKYACHQNSHLTTAQITFVTSLHKLLGTWKNKVNKYLVLTEFAKSKFLNSSLDLKDDQIIVKPNSVDDYGVAASTDRKNVFLYVGRLSNEKGLEILLNATNLRDFKLEIIGDGPLLNKVLDFQKRNKNIKYLGFQNKEFIIDRLKHCLALVFPSISYEGLPLIILEAFSTGTPIISSDIGNINTIVRKGINGLHFESGNAKSLAATIGYFQSNICDLSHLYLNARETFEKNYIHSKNYELLVKAYENVLKGK